MYALRRLPSAERVALIIAVPIATMLYAWHWYPGPGGRVWYGDSVSFQFYAISHSLGHPPGYPQYLALTRAVARVPLGQAWQRVDFISSVFGALALCAQYSLARLVGLRVAAATVAAVALGMSRTFFTQATEAEVYSLHSFWILTCCALFIRYLSTRKRYSLMIFFLAYGCSLGHHPMMVLLVLPVFFTVVVHDRSLFKDWRAYAAAALALLIGLAQYVYTYRLFTDDHLVYRFAYYPEYSLRNFIDFTTGGGFKSKMFSQPLATVWHDRVPKILQLANAQNTFVLPALGLCGIAASPAIKPAHRTLLLLSMAAFLVWALGYDVDDIEAFCVPLWALSYVAALPGLQSLLPGRSAVLAFALSLALCVMAFHYAMLDPEFYRPNNQRLAIANEYIAHVPRGAALVPWKLDGNSALPALFRYLEASGDSGPIRVVQSVKRCRSDVYFTDAARRQIQVKNYHERRVAQLERSAQDLFVMECERARP